MKNVGYVALIGRPSCGKSTLLNTIIDEKISIVSNIPQTTRNIVRAIYQDKDSQIIFLDSPGYHTSEKKFNSYLLSQVTRNLKEADVIVYMIDGTRKMGKEEQEIINILKKEQKDIVVLVNKIDTIKDSDKIQKTIKKQLKSLNIKIIFLISALKKTNLKKFIEYLKNLLPKDILLYPEDYYTDQLFHFRVSEIVREKIFQYAKDEIPHSIYTELDEFEEKEEKNLLILKITIYVERQSQKRIIIGKNGSFIKKIGKPAREDLEKIFGRNIYLDLHVKVKKKWRKKEDVLKKMFKM